MNVPDEVRDRLKKRLWVIADEIDWLALGPVEKTLRYEDWARDPEIGGVLTHYMDIRQLRIYIKDTLLKKYPQARQADAKKPFQLLGIPHSVQVSKVFIRPHGCRLADGRVVCWGRAADWKGLLMAVHERTFQFKGATPFAVVLLHCAGKFAAAESRVVVRDAATKLGVEHLVWDEHH